ncbi:hypothetical protein [Pseudomonas chlororaphis]|uniref:hypothetical protein n=1 Tax=Pseudomonas chlororaphis TaxID=587753 RepID=UPI0015DF1791|nr:hypothetical protein [Pseudomonas chlororaphis]QLL13465.1 hypothetical protein H0I86_31670 [Pseudomonas chlororaphis subsp. aurantiaca]
MHLSLQRYQYTVAPSPMQTATSTEQPQGSLGQLLERLQNGQALSTNQQKQVLHVLAQSETNGDRERPGELNGQGVTLRDEQGAAYFSLPGSHASSGKIELRGQDDGLFHGLDAERRQTASGPFLHALLSAARGTEVETNPAHTDDLAQHLGAYALAHAEELERSFENLGPTSAETAPTVSAANDNGDVQEHLLRNVLTRTVSQVATRISARMLDQVLAGTVLEGLRFEDMTQLQPVLEQFRDGERPLTLRLQGLADALGRVARSPDGAVANAQQCLELCLKAARLAETIRDEGVSLDAMQRALTHMHEALEQPMLKSWGDTSGARATLVQASQWLGELAPFLGHDVSLKDFLVSLSESPTLKEILSTQYQGAVQVFDELGSLFGALRERQVEAPAASSLGQVAWLLGQVGSSQLGQLLSERLSDTFEPLFATLQSAKHAVAALREFPSEQSMLQQLQWLGERMGQGDFEQALPRALRESLQDGIRGLPVSLGHMLHLAPQLARYPKDGDWQEKLSWGAQLLSTPDASPFLQQVLPEPLSQLLVKPFQALHQAQDFPSSASPLAQLQWTASLLARPENLALLQHYAPAGYDQVLAQLGNLSALSQSAAALRQTLASDSAWPSKVKGVAQLLLQPLAQELKRHPELLLKTASWASGGNKTTVGAALTALRLYTTMPQGLSPSEKTSWIFKSALREVLNEYSATLGLAVTHGEKFRTLLNYAKQTVQLYQAWSNPKRMERELGNLTELLKRDLPLPDNLKPLLDALPALPALLHAHQQYKAQPDSLPWQERLSRIGGQLSSSDSLALKRVLDSVEAYAVNGLVDGANRAMQALSNHDPLKFPAAQANNVPPGNGVSSLIDANDPYIQAFEALAAQAGVGPATHNVPSAPAATVNASAAPSIGNTSTAALMAGGGALGLIGSLGLLGYGLYQRNQPQEAMPRAFEMKVFSDKRPEATGQAANGSEREKLVANWEIVIDIDEVKQDTVIDIESSEHETLVATNIAVNVEEGDLDDGFDINEKLASMTPSSPPRSGGGLQSTPALVMLGLVAGASGLAMAKGLYDLSNVPEPASPATNPPDSTTEPTAPTTDQPEAASLAPLDELDYLNLTDDLDRIDGEVRELLAHGQTYDIDELQRLIDDIDQTLELLGDIEGALGVNLDDVPTKATATHATVQAHHRAKRSIGSNDIRTQQQALHNADAALQKDPNDLGALAQSKQSLSRLRRDLESLQLPASQSEALTTAQKRKAEQVIQAVDRLLEPPEFPPSPIDFLEIQLTALATKHDCLNNIDRKTKVKVNYVSERAKFGLNTMISAEKRSVKEFDLIDILRREHIRFLNKNNEGPGYERISFNDARLPNALLNDILATDVEAQYHALIDAFKADAHRNPELLAKRKEKLQKNIQGIVKNIVNKYPRFPDISYLKKFLQNQQASQAKLNIPGTPTANLKDSFFIETRNGGGFLFFLNNQRVYKLPENEQARRTFIEGNQNLQKDIKAALPLFEQLDLGDKSLRYAYSMPNQMNLYKGQYVPILAFQKTSNIVDSLSNIGLEHDKANMDTLAVSDGEISWDKWMAAARFASFALSLALPVAAAAPALASRAMLLGVLNTVQTLGLSTAPNVLKSMYADLPEERAQALKAATIDLIGEVGGWGLTGLSKVGAFNKLSEKVNNIVNKMKKKPVNLPDTPPVQMPKRPPAQELPIDLLKTKPQYQAVDDFLKERIQGYARYVQTPALNCSHAMRDVISALEGRLPSTLSVRNIEKVGVIMAKPEGVDSLANHFLVKANINNKDMVIDLTAGQFRTGHNITGGGFIGTLDEWLETFSKLEKNNGRMIAIKTTGKNVDLVKEVNDTITNAKNIFDLPQSGFNLIHQPPWFTQASAHDLAQRFAETWKNSREKLLGSLDQLGDAMPFNMESLPGPLLSRLDKQLLKATVKTLLPNSDSDVELNRLLDEIEQKRQQLLGNQAISESTTATPSSTSSTASTTEASSSTAISALNLKLQQMVQLMPSSIERDDLSSIMANIEHIANQLNFDSYLREDINSPSAQETQRLISDLQNSLKAREKEIDQIEDKFTNYIKIGEFYIYYDAITTMLSDSKRPSDSD